MTIQEYEAKLKVQNYACEICGTKDTPTTNGSKWHMPVDHDHKTGKVRGLICNNCNSILAHARDRTDILKKCTAYLEKYAAHM